MTILLCMLATLTVAYLGIAFIAADFFWLWEFMDNSGPDDRARLLGFTCVVMAFGASIGIMFS